MRARSVALSALAGVLVGVLVIVLRTSMGSGPPLVIGARSDFERAPIPGGELMTLAEARAIIPFGLPLPAHALTGITQISEVWADPEGKALAIRFANGALTYEVKPYVLDTAAETYLKASADGIKADASVYSLPSGSALVIQPDTDLDKANPAWVEIVRDDLDINIYSETLSAETLLDIASSVVPVSETPSDG